MKFNTQELKEKIEGKYMKFELGNVYEVRVNPEQDIAERDVEFEKDGVKQTRTKFDLEIEVNGQNKIWSVSKRVLTLINDNITKTILFNVIMTKENYNIIPIINKKE